MAKGGARARSGPPPDPNALRRDRPSDGEWVSLPAEGRDGPPPEWPLEQQTDREAVLWELFWSLPQAVMWERHRQEHFVALYVRRAAEAERRDAPTALTTLVKQMSEDLGISTGGLHRNRWRIEDAEPVSGPVRSRSGAGSVKDRFKVVDGGAA